MSNEHKVVITKNETENSLTFQFSSEDSAFVERMTEEVMTKYFGYEKNKSAVRGFDKYRGYIGAKISDKSHEKSSFSTGIRVNDYGKEKFRCHYICPNCNNEGNHYIDENVKLINCHECSYKIKPLSIETEYGVTVDKYNNYYYAGNYVPSDLV